jgi:hypothetical protein
MIYWIATIGIFITNLPFGYWRTNVKKYSMSWIAAIHIPALMIITFRALSGMGFQLFTFPLFVGAFFSGQLSGGKIYTWRKVRSKLPLSGCLVWDLVSNFIASYFPKV